MVDVTLHTLSKVRSCKDVYLHIFCMYVRIVCNSSIKIWSYKMIKIIGRILAKTSNISGREFFVPDFFSLNKNPFHTFWQKKLSTLTIFYKPTIKKNILHFFYTFRHFLESFLDFLISLNSLFSSSKCFHISFSFTLDSSCFSFF